MLPQYPNASSQLIPPLAADFNQPLLELVHVIDASLLVYSIAWGTNSYSRPGFKARLFGGHRLGAMKSQWSHGSLVAAAEWCHGRIIFLEDWTCRMRLTWLREAGKIFRCPTHLLAEMYKKCDSAHARYSDWHH